MSAEGAASLVDTHCHLALIEDRGYLDAALERAVRAGIGQIVSVGLDLEDSDRNRRLAERFPGVYFSVGWHPHRPAPPGRGELAALSRLLEHPRAVAAGEVGLDRFWRPGYHETPLEVQRRSLRAMLELAVGAGKPVIIHDREAHDDVLEELALAPRARAVMHCFSGDAAHAKRCLRAGHVLSFAGPLTYPANASLREAARLVPPGRLVVETDAPFLPPQRHRGEPNEPAHVAETASALAAARGEPPESIRAETAAAARAFFGLDPADTLRAP